MARPAGFVILILFVVSVALPSAGECQVNIEKYREEEQTRGVHGSLELDFSWRTGNVDVLELGGASSIFVTREQGTALLLGSGELGWEGGSRFSNAALGHARLAFQVSKRVLPEVFFQGDYDRARLLTRRGLVGSGLRLGVVVAEQAQVWWGTALMFEYESLDLPVGAIHKMESSVVRWSNYLSAKVLFHPQIALDWVVYVQPDIRHFVDFRVLNDWTLSVRASELISLITTIKARYDRRPPDDIKRLDAKLQTGVSVSF
jgi:hypothetical protein